MKTTIFNLIILDESGSMSPFVEETINGCNETLNVARYSAEQNADTIRSFVSIYAFQSGGPESRYIVKNANPKDVKDITKADYQPCGCTPLLDAVGSTLTELMAVAATHDDATGIVTIMTDGYENSSVQYSPEKVASLIEACREMGWTINLIGANIDIAELANKLKINKENAIKYQQTKAGSADMWANFSANISRHVNEEAEYSRCCAEAPLEERMKSRKSRSKGFFRK